MRIEHVLALRTMRDGIMLCAFISVCGIAGFYVGRYCILRFGGMATLMVAAILNIALYIYARVKRHCEKRRS